MASPSTPEISDLVAQLLTYESVTSAGQQGGRRILEKLRFRLGKVLGPGGYHALVSRALVLASAEVLWLRALHISAEGILEGVDDLQSQVDNEEFCAGELVLVSNLLGLLLDLLGPDLTRGLVLEQWQGGNASDNPEPNPQDSHE